jgi:hypothetical protein
MSRINPHSVPVNVRASHADARDELQSRNNLARRVHHYAVLGSRWIESRGKCGFFPHAQQQFGGPGDSRTNSQASRLGSFKEIDCVISQRLTRMALL